MVIDTYHFQSASLNHLAFDKIYEGNQLTKILIN